MYNVPRCFTFGNCEERSEFYPGKIPQHEWKRPAGNGSLCSALRRRGYYYSPQISTTGLGNNFSTFNHIQVRGSSHWMVFYWLAVGWRGGGGEERGWGWTTFMELFYSGRKTIFYLPAYQAKDWKSHSLQTACSTVYTCTGIVLWEKLNLFSYQILLKIYKMPDLYHINIQAN